MKILNLTDLEKSDIKYQIQNFPDGQQNIIIKNTRINLIQQEIEIKTRLNNFQDLELIICATKTLRNLGVKEIHLYTPYFLGSRSDRQFEEGSCNYLKDVICPIINSLNFESVTVLDPHSHVLEACLNGFKKENNEKLVKFALNNIYHNEFSIWNNSFDTMKDKFVLLSPDAGASHKIYKLAEQIGYKGDIITCSKERDNDGKLTKCVIPEFDINKDIIIIDDIFDYGKTFTNIAREITNRSCKGKLYLIVTHSIQTEGLKEALIYFDVIYTTNSYKDHNLERVKQLNVF
jgi:ribose-phosphate pyrophosphokinase